MMKSSFGPTFSIFPAKPRPLLNRPLKALATFAQPPPPPARENAPPNNTSLPEHLPGPASAYVHLPFCRKRCHYCDFPIVALGSALPPADPDPRMANYVHLLQREITSTRLCGPSQMPLETVFFGGGTPSLVPPSLVSSILDTLRGKFGISSGAEISMEMDPGTFDAKKLKELVGLGVNRVSLGVQAFQEELLRACGRAHGVKEVYEAIDIVLACGVENWSLDLISSLPNQTSRSWEESLRLTVEEARPTHVSVYDLQVEKGTKFGTLYTPGEFPLPSEVLSAEFYRMASRVLSGAGYNHYEISSYCKDGFECKHNYTYWLNKPFYAFGLGSASYLDGVRFSRPRKMKEYADYVQRLENGAGDSPVVNHVDPKDWALDVVMLSLRTARGLDVRSFGERFGDSLVSSLLNVYKPYIESGHVICLDEEKSAITVDDLTRLVTDEDAMSRRLAFVRLSDPDGFLLSNELISLAFGVISP